MSVLFSITYFVPYVSGLTICVSRLVDHLSQKHHTTVLTMQHDPALPRTEKNANRSIVRAVPMLKISKGFLSFDWIFQAYKQARINDVIVINLPQLEGIMPALFAKLFNKRIVAIVHCEIQLPKGLMNQCIGAILSFSHVITLALADQIVTYTEDYRDHISMFNRVREKTIAILPPVPTPGINQTVEKRLKKQIGDASLIIGISSRLAAEKGIEYVLEAIPHITKAWNGSFKIVMAGPLNPVGEEAYKKKIFSLVRSYSDQVIFLDTLSQDEIGAFYHLLDVLVLPSLNSTEAFGMVQVEAMLCGVPVIATDLPGVRVPVQLTGMGRIIPRHSATAIAEAVIDVVKHKKEYIKSNTKIREIFSLQKTFSAYKTVLNIV